MFVAAVNDATERALSYARSLHTEVRAVYFALDPQEIEEIQEEWADRRFPVPARHRRGAVPGPRAAHAGRRSGGSRRGRTRSPSVIVPEVVAEKWRHRLLHNQRALFIKRLLLFEPGVILTSVPYQSIRWNIDDARALAREKTDKDTTYRHLVSVEGVMRRLGPALRRGRAHLVADGAVPRPRPGSDGRRPRAARLPGRGLAARGGGRGGRRQRRPGARPSPVPDGPDVEGGRGRRRGRGLLVASALVRPERSAGMKVSSVKKKLKEKAFAPGVNREEIGLAETNLGLSLDEFIGLAIEGLQEVAPEIGL